MDIDKRLERLKERRSGGTQKIKAGRESGYGAGVLFQAADTGRFLFVQRSNTGDMPGTWCCGGGGVEPHETIDQAVKRECVEELGYNEPYDLIHMARMQSDGFIFHNHLAVVPTEFEPVLNDEHTGYQWCDSVPENCHPGLANAIQEFIQRNAALRTQDGS